jgi:cytidine deaminase
MDEHSAETRRPGTVDGLSASARGLIDVAAAAKVNSYSPYSRYQVGAAVRTRSGAVFAGCNVENSAYPEGTCAEAGAIAAMVVAGEREIVEVVTVTEGESPGTPCGGCRQRLREFAGPDVEVHAATTSGAVVTLSVAELLPESFGPGHLRPT